MIVDATPSSLANRELERNIRSGPIAYVSPDVPSPAVSPMISLVLASGIWNASTPTTVSPSTSGVAMKPAGSMSDGR